MERILRRGHTRLVDLNTDLILWFRELLGLRTPVLRSSTLDVSGKRTELLVDICRAVGADHYLSPEGSRAYIEGHDLFALNGIGLSYQHYRTPPYRQLHGAFIPSLSILDLMLNEGDQSLAIIRAGRHGA